MSTSKPISTITYNTKDFLISTLNSLVNLGYITYYEFIEHQADTDDKKKHIHLFMLPAKSINLATFKNFFLEKDPNNDLPLSPTIFRSSVYGDWYWYALHEPDYLRSKGQTRNITYTDRAIISYDQTTHFQMVLDNPLENFCKMSDMFLHDFVIKCVYDNVSLADCLKNKFIPLGKVQSVIAFYNAIAICREETKSQARLDFQRSLLMHDIMYKNAIIRLKECPNDNSDFKDDLFD